MTNSCCLCWSCRNPHFASAVSFHSCRFSIIPTVDVIVQVNMHSFLPCFTNMHSALIQESDTFHNSYWLFLVWGGGNTLTAVTRLHCLVVGILYVVPMERRAFAFSFFLRGKTPTRLFGYPCVCSAHHCSQVQWAHFFVTALLFALPSDVCVFCTSTKESFLKWHQIIPQLLDCF